VGDPAAIPDGSPGTGGDLCLFAGWWLSVVDNPDPVYSGDYLTYTIHITNVGTLTATNVVVTETYPMEVSFLGASPPPDVGANIWYVPDMPAQSFFDIIVYVQVGATVPSGTVILNRVTVDSAETDPLTEQEDTLVLQPPQPPGLAADKTDFPDPVAHMGTLTYTLAITNVGSQILTGVVVTETYPYGAVYQSANPPPTSGDNVWLFLPLAPGQFVHIEIYMQVIAPSGMVLTNTATVDSAETPPVVVQELTLIQGRGSPFSLGAAGARFLVDHLIWARVFW
jgi:uncharacterized repeat protein (TIGR01451 family)